MIKKKYYVLMVLILTFVVAIFVDSTNKNQYITNIEKGIKYIESTKKNTAVASFFEVERNSSVSMKILYTITPNEDPQDFNSCIELLSFVKNYPYTTSKSKGNLEQKIYLMKCVIQIDKNNDTEICHLPIYFNDEFDYFAIPRDYNNRTEEDSTNLAFYYISDVKYQQIAKSLFRQ